MKHSSEQASNAQLLSTGGSTSYKTSIAALSAGLPFCSDQKTKSSNLMWTTTIHHLQCIQNQQRINNDPTHTIFRSGDEILEEYPTEQRTPTHSDCTVTSHHGDFTLSVYNLHTLNQSFGKLGTISCLSWSNRAPRVFSHLRQQFRYSANLSRSLIILWLKLFAACFIEHRFLDRATDWLLIRLTECLVRLRI